LGPSGFVTTFHPGSSTVQPLSPKTIMATLSLPTTADYASRELAARLMLRGFLRVQGIPVAVLIMKRIIDLAFVLTVFSLGGWLFLLIALAIRLDSPGPIFYRQKRAGALRGRDAHGRCTFEVFDMLKFRTMRVDAEKMTGEVLAETGDLRVTRVGRILRKTRLDELPQIWNVLKRDMSLVGPRPERPELLANLALAIPFFEERMLGTKPGITGFAQVSLGYAGHAPVGSRIAALEGSLTNPFRMAGTEGSIVDDMRLKLLFDLAYVVALNGFWTFLALELLIILKTPWVMLRGLGR
jgi:lipopolysaccharide/colanic/teichoic acid biosynthesis glycosyltransferase